MSAEALSCPACGGAVAPGARRCDYCQTPLATVRCGRCFSMNPPTAMNCSACGWELGLEPLGEPASLQCPDCQRPMEAFGTDMGYLYDCGQCGSQFAEHHLLEELFREREDGPRQRRRPLPPLPPDRVRYLPCPVCQRRMNRKNFGLTSGVIVDECTDHGIWFDHGELPHVLAFVEAGGLRQARQRAATTSRLPMASLPSGTFDDPAPNLANVGGPVVDEFAAAVDDLIDQFRSWLRRSSRR